MGKERDGSKKGRKSDRNQKMEKDMLSVKKYSSTRKDGCHHRGGPRQREKRGWHGKCVHEKAISGC
jgi:hypothetical protein